MLSEQSASGIGLTFIDGLLPLQVCYFDRSHAPRGNGNTVLVICKPSLVGV
ncbi:MAG: hypothetical protein ACJAXN_001106, partial [Psychromonas sp.]